MQRRATAGAVGDRHRRALAARSNCKAWDSVSGVTEHVDFWMAVATISPLAIATNLLTVGQVVIHKYSLSQDVGERSFTSWLRVHHLWWVGLNLTACLVLIGLALASMWSHDDAAPGWLVILLLLAMLVELCVLSVCTESVLDRARHRGAVQTGGQED